MATVEEAAEQDSGAAADLSQIRQAVEASGGTLSSVATTGYVDDALDRKLQELDVSEVGF